MNSPLKKAFNVLDKAKSESMSDKHFEVFNRVEKRVAATSRAKMAGFMAQFRADAEKMTPIQILQERHSSKRLGISCAPMDTLDKPQSGKRTI